MSAPADPRARSAREPGLAATVAVYARARLGLLALIAALLLMAGTPLVIALLVALIVALPRSMFALAAARARRGEERAALRARLRGEEPEPPAGTAQAVEAPEDGAEPAAAPEAGAEAPDAGSGDRPERQPDARRD